MRLKKTTITHNPDGTSTVRHTKQSIFQTAVDKLTGLLEAIEARVMKEVGDLRGATSTGFERVEVDIRSLNESAKDLREDMDRAWALNESRNSVHRKAAEDLTAALQRFNERLSRLEGEPKAAAVFQHLTGMNGRIEILEGKTGMLSECIGAYNDRLNIATRRIQNLEDLRVLYSTPYALENGDTLVVTTTKPDGQGERVSAKVYSPSAYARHIERLTGANAEPGIKSTRGMRVPVVFATLDSDEKIPEHCGSEKQVIECRACYEEEGSFNCIRPSHKQTAAMIANGRGIAAGLVAGEPKKIS